MSKRTDAAELIELAKTGHSGAIMSGPIREGMSTTTVLPQLSNLFDSDLHKHQVVIGKSRDGMSFFSNQLQEQVKTTPGAQKATFDKGGSSNLLTCLLRRI